MNNWKELKTWLDKEIIDTTNPTLQLTDPAKNKYKLSELASSEIEFNTALTNFYTSLEGTLDKHNDVHLLPEFKQEKNWDQLFSKSTTYFGKKTENQPLASDIYDKLWTIYEDWQEYLLVNELEEEYQAANFDELFKHEDIDEEITNASNINYMSNKQKDKMLKKWQGWLKKYGSLTEEQKKNLAEENKKVTKLVEILKDAQEHSVKAKEENGQESDWTKNLPTKEIGIGIVIGLGIYLIYGWLGEKK